MLLIREKETEEKYRRIRGESIIPCRGKKKDGRMEKIFDLDELVETLCEMQKNTSTGKVA